MNFKIDVLVVLLLVSVFNIWSKYTIALLVVALLFWMCIINGEWKNETTDKPKKLFITASVEQTVD